jgi:uncharacterized protein YwgA
MQTVDELLNELPLGSEGNTDYSCFLSMHDMYRLRACLAELRRENDYLTKICYDNVQDFSIEDVRGDIIEADIQRRESVKEVWETVERLRDQIKESFRVW